MPKFVYIYHAPTPPADAAPPDPEQMEEVMRQWIAWSQRVGKGLVDFGTPLAGGTRVDASGDTQPSTSDVVGYTILEADSRDAAVDLARSHPHLQMSGGCVIEVHESQPMPGM
ncbi:YciI family protein [Glycomyces sp. L485]|uniref:YciI family protein n=1 Tax=Glycomyces sp. L485 TaxID=2909235 RepID=UPI001F4B4EA8|nr:YciI family protein [Glycomyces sp. L485]MCH7229347.1 YciI family protein [Glycomyces sp. L485]